MGARGKRLAGVFLNKPLVQISALAKRRRQRVLFVATLLSALTLPAAVALVMSPPPSRALLLTSVIILAQSAAGAALAARLWRKSPTASTIIAVVVPIATYPLMLSFLTLTGLLVTNAAINWFCTPFLAGVLTCALGAVGLFDVAHANTDTRACASCGYSLTGLPSENPCPECGAGRGAA